MTQKHHKSAAKQSNSAIKHSTPKQAPISKSSGSKPSKRRAAMASEPQQQDARLEPDSSPKPNQADKLQEADEQAKGQRQEPAQCCDLGHEPAESAMPPADQPTGAPSDAPSVEPANNGELHEQPELVDQTQLIIDDNCQLDDDLSGAAASGRKMFVGGLSWQTGAEALRDYFSSYGEIVETMIMNDPTTRRSR